MNLPVAVAGRDAAGLTGTLEALHGPVTVVRRCTELAELIAVCQTGFARAAIVAGGAEEITADLVERLALAGVALVALADEDEAVRRLEVLGVIHAPLNTSGPELASLVTAAVESLGKAEGCPAGNSWSAAYADPALALKPAAPSLTDDAGPGGGAGTITAVWGPAGAPGRTTVALNLAAEMALMGRRVLLMDADTYGASVAASLGLLDESAGLAQVCRLADQGQLDHAALERISAQVVIKGFRMRVLTGITRPDRWAELRGAALGAVLDAARGFAEEIVIDCGFSLEADEELSFDTVAPRRNAATLRSLELADTIYAVGSADAIGIPRLVRALSELDDVVPGTAPRVLLNKVRAAAVGRSPERQLRDAWLRHGPMHRIAAFLPWDPEAADAALLAGSALVEAAPQSPLRESLAGLVGGALTGRRRAPQGVLARVVKFLPNGATLVR